MDNLWVLHAASDPGCGELFCNSAYPQGSAAGWELSTGLSTPLSINVNFEPLRGSASPEFRGLCFALLLLDPVGQLGDLVVDGPPLSHEFPDLAVRVDHGGVIPSTELDRKSVV